MIGSISGNMVGSDCSAIDDLLGGQMASLKEHCEDCRRELGEDFKHVHEWLDALFKVLGPKHRSGRHHTGGVEEVRKMWGDHAARAAEIHIRKDYGGGLPSKNEVQLWGIFGPPEA
jgi:hypothetical protein